MSYSKDSKHVACVNGVCPRDLHDECADGCYLWWRELTDREDKGYDW
jgi:hypothetical protein